MRRADERITAAAAKIRMSLSESSPHTARLVEHVLSLRDETLPAQAVTAAKTFILDTLGVALSGTRVPLVRDLHAIAASWGTSEACRVWGSGERVPVATAAFINGYQIHNQEWDCVHEGAVVHPMAVVLSTLIAAAEAQGGVTGTTLLRGCILAVDVAATIGAAARNKLRFFRPAICGALGATAALAAMRGFDAERTRSAMGLAYSQASGTMQAHVEGSPVLPMQIGFNARAALAAIEMADRGIQGPRHFLEGPFGYFSLFDPEWDAAPFAALGREWCIAQLSHKPFPSGRATHGGADGALTLRDRHGFTAQDVAELRIHAPPLVIQLVDRPARPDMAPSYARLCAPYVVATALLEGDVVVEDFEPAAIARPQRQELASRIRVLRDANPSLNALAPQRVEVDLREGSRFAIDLPAVLGAPGRPLTRERHLAKFRRAARSARPAPPPAALDALEQLVEHLERLPDVRMLVDALTGEHGREFERTPAET